MKEILTAIFFLILILANNLGYAAGKSIEDWPYSGKNKTVLEKKGTDKNSSSDLPVNIDEDIEKRVFEEKPVEYVEPEDKPFYLLEDMHLVSFSYGVMTYNALDHSSFNQFGKLNYRYYKGIFKFFEAGAGYSKRPNYILSLDYIYTVKKLSSLRPTMLAGFVYNFPNQFSMANFFNIRYMAINTAANLTYYFSFGMFTRLDLRVEWFYDYGWGMRFMGSLGIGIYI